MLDGHRTAERRSLESHRRIAEQLDEALLNAARVRVEKWLLEGGPVDPYWADRWRVLLAEPPDQVASRLAEDSEAMRDLRQTTPFAGVLPPRERWKIVREIR